MYHCGAQFLIDHWTALPGAASIPARARFEPMRFGVRTAGLFLADRNQEAGRLRLAGGLVEQFHGRHLTGAPWMSGWREDSRAELTEAVHEAFRQARPMVITASAPGLSGLIQIATAPLRGPSGAADRFVGLYQPLDPEDRSAKSVGPFTLVQAEIVAIEQAGVRRRPGLSLASLNGRLIEPAD